MEPKAPENENQPVDRRQYYQTQAEQLFRTHGGDFDEFVRGYEGLVTEGDKLLSTYGTTGYNFIKSEAAMPLGAADKKIFYGNYIGRSRHLGLLLAAMETAGLITEQQVHLDVRAAKALDDPDWAESTEEHVATHGTILRTNAQGETTPHPILTSVELVAAFSPETDEQAQAIAAFLQLHTRAGQPEAIAGSNVTPDIRATAALRGTLPSHMFSPATANILGERQAQVIALRHTTALPDPWRPQPVVANSELVTYLVGEGVGP